MIITLETIIKLNSELTFLKDNNYSGNISTEDIEYRFTAENYEYQTFYRSGRFSVDFDRNAKSIELNTTFSNQCVDKDFLKEMKMLQDIIKKALKA